jgi:hypothetical protein
MSGEKKAILFMVVGALVCFLVFFSLSKGSFSNTNVMTSKSDTVVVVKVVHDTLRVTVPYEKIKVVTVVKYMSSVDVVIKKPIDTTGSVVPSKPVDSTNNNVVKDTQTCYEASIIEKDSAKIEISICSDSLPKQKPIDLSIHLNYTPAPIQQITITKTNDIYHFYPIYKDWRAYVFAGATFVLGVYVSHHL